MLHAAPSALPVEIYATTDGARIMDDDTHAPESPSERRDGHDIYLPNHVEAVSHIAIDVGGSLAKVVYFARSAGEAEDESRRAGAGSSDEQDERASQLSGTLNPTALAASSSDASKPTAAERAGTPTLAQSRLKRHSLPSHFPGGRLNFCKFETGDIGEGIQFLRDLIQKSAVANGVSVEQMKRSVKLVATGGGGHLFYDLFESELGVEVQREDEMECLITGLNFMTLIPDEVFYSSDELVDALSLAYPKPEVASRQRDDSTRPLRAAEPGELPRPSPTPPLYSPLFESRPSPKLPALLVNIGSGVSILKIDEGGKFERVSGTSLGGGTLWGLLALLTDARNFDEMLELSERGDNSTVDMLVGDIYGPVGLNHLGLKASMIASSFGKVLRRDQGNQEPEGDSTVPLHERRLRKFNQEDICRSLLYTISNNIGQIAHLNAEKYNIDRIYFGGCFIRGHPATIATLSYAIRFWSQGRRRAYFLRHEGYLGAVGAWIKRIGREAHRSGDSPGDSDTDVPQGANMSANAAPVAMPVPDLSGATTGGADGVSAGGALPGGLPAQLADALGGQPPDGHAAPREPEDSNMSTAELLAALDEVKDEQSESAGENAESIASLLKRMDNANDAADALETRVDGLLAKLGTLLGERQNADA